MVRFRDVVSVEPLYAIDFGGEVILQADLVCIDMFQTLVDIDSRIPIIWQRILKDNYSDEIGRMCARQVGLKAINQFHETGCKASVFYNLKTLFAPCFREIAIETNLGFDPDSALGIFLLEHGNSVIYEDSLQFFKLIDGRVPVCLVSDADSVMIKPLLNKFKFDCVFISEDVGSYKNDNDSKMFKKVLEHYQIKPDKVLHIGDSSSDIVGANKVGIKSCWINRQHLAWKYAVRPDFIVNSLVDVIDLIS